MILTTLQQALLEAPFRADEHRFNDSGYIYLSKQAIRRRLSLVDPNWSQSEPRLVAQTHTIVSLSSTITVCGSTRSAVGVGVIQRWKTIDEKQPDKSVKKVKVEVEGYDLASAERKAYKTADADLLPRIAFQFGIGSYLKTDAGKKVKTEESLKEFLAKLPPPPDAHWSFNGGRQRVGEFMKLVHLEWDSIKALVEPGKVLTGLSDTDLSEVQFIGRLAELAFKPAAPKLEATTASH